MYMWVITFEGQIIADGYNTREEAERDRLVLADELGQAPHYFIVEGRSA